MNGSKLFNGTLISEKMYFVWWKNKRKNKPEVECPVKKVREWTIRWRNKIKEFFPYKLALWHAYQILKVISVTSRYSCNDQAYNQNVKHPLASWAGTPDITAIWYPGAYKRVLNHITMIPRTMSHTDSRC